MPEKYEDSGQIRGAAPNNACDEYVMLYRFLLNIQNIKDEALYDKIYDILADHMDVLWFRMSEEEIKKLGDFF